MNSTYLTGILEGSNEIISWGSAKETVKGTMKGQVPSLTVCQVWSRIDELGMIRKKNEMLPDLSSSIL